MFQPISPTHPYAELAVKAITSLNKMLDFDIKDFSNPIEFRNAIYRHSKDTEKIMNEIQFNAKQGLLTEDRAIKLLGAACELMEEYKRLKQLFRIKLERV